jgi:hypothetical protein
LREVLFQNASDRRKAQKARKRREKRRRKKAVLAEGEQSYGSKEPVDRSVVSEAGGSQPPIENWEPPIEGDDRTEGGGNDRTAGNRLFGHPVEAGAQRPRESPQSYRSLKKWKRVHRMRALI